MVCGEIRKVFMYIMCICLWHFSDYVCEHCTSVLEIWVNAGDKTNKLQKSSTNSAPHSEKTEQWVQIKPNKRIICCKTNGFFHAKAKDISTAWKFDVICDVLRLVSNVEYWEKEPNSDVIYEIWWAAVLVHMLWKLVRFLNQDIFQTVKNIWKGKIQISQDIFHKYKNGKINAHMKHDEIYIYAVLVQCTSYSTCIW